MLRRLITILALSGSIAFSVLWIANVAVVLAMISPYLETLRELVAAWPLFYWLAGLDLSTVSTLVPALYCTCLTCALKWRNRWWWYEGPLAPFPEWFASFGVWAGLFGTLIGMMIGLPAAGLSDSPQARDALLLLLSGFKTAVLSSVIGVLFAGIAIITSKAWNKFELRAVSIAPLATISDVLSKLELLGQCFEESRSPVTAMSTEVAMLTIALVQARHQLEVLVAALDVDRCRKLLSDVDELTRVDKNIFDLLQHARSEAIERDSARDALEQQRHEAVMAALADIRQVAHSYQDRMSRGYASLSTILASENNLPNKANNG